MDEGGPRRMGMNGWELAIVAPTGPLLKAFDTSIKAIPQVAQGLSVVDSSSGWVLKATLGSATAFLSSALSFSTIGLGVPAGTKVPIHETNS